MNPRTGFAFGILALLVAVGLLVMTRDVSRDPQAGMAEVPAVGGNEGAEPFVEPIPARTVVETESTPEEDTGPSAISPPTQLLLDTTFLYHARIVAEATGESLAGVTLRAIENGERVAAPLAYSGADGVVSLELERDSPRLLRIELEGYAWILAHARRGHEQPEDAQLVTLARTAALRAEVLRQGTPVRDLQVSASTPAHRMRPPGALFLVNVNEDPVWSATTDAGGVAQLQDLPPNVPLTVDVHEDGALVQRASRPVVLDPGEVRELVLSIGSGCTIRGVALEPDGTPVEGLGIWLRVAPEPKDEKIFRDSDREHVAARALTDAYGAFAFHDVGLGDWWVGLAPQGTSRGLIAPLARLVTVAEGELWQDVELHVHHGLYLGGRVVGPAGEPAEGVSVSVMGTGLGASAYEGKFRIGPLGPGEYTLFAYAGANRGLSTSANVVAAAGTEDLVLELRAAAALAGKCVGANGAPAPATVTVIPVDRQAARFWSRPAGFREDGRFEVTRLVPGLYHVLAIDELGNVGVLGNVEARAGETTGDLRVALAPEAIVNVTVAGPSEGVWPITLQHGLELHVGAGRIVVPPGPVTVELRRLDPATNTLVAFDARDVNALAGEEVEVVFE